MSLIPVSTSCTQRNRVIRITVYILILNISGFEIMHLNELTPQNAATAQSEKNETPVSLLQASTVSCFVSLS